MASNAFDNTGRGQPEVQTPSTQPLDLSRVLGSERNVQAISASLSQMENYNSSASMYPFPDLTIYHGADLAQVGVQTGADALQTNLQPNADVTLPNSRPAIDQNFVNTDVNLPSTDASSPPKAAGDSTAPPADQSWKSHLNDQWVQDSLKNNPGWHAMEGMHPGEIAVGNWEPSKEEKKVLANAVDKMMAEHNNGPAYVTLPDGSQCKIEIVQGGHGQSFSKSDDTPDANGRKPRKVSFGLPNSTNDSDSETSEGETDDTSATPISQIQNA